MTLHRQDSGRSWYAWCECGACGPLRATRFDAERDELEHQCPVGGLSALVRESIQRVLS